MHSIIVLVQCLRVKLQDWEWWIDLPELTTIQLGDTAFWFNYKNESSELIMRSEYDEVNWTIDLPKLATLTAEKYSTVFQYPHSITLESLSFHWSLTSRHALSRYCWSSSCLRMEKSIILQQFFKPKRMMNRHWWIDQSSEHSQAQSQSKHSLCGWTPESESECGRVDCR